jgi:hypothetical protein
VRRPKTEVVMRVPLGRRCSAAVIFTTGPATPSNSGAGSVPGFDRARAAFVDPGSPQPARHASTTARFIKSSIPS